MYTGDNYEKDRVYNLSYRCRGQGGFISDCSRKEVCEAIDGVVYKNLNPEIITINENGLVYPTGIVGLAKVIVMCGGKSFEVEVEIKE